MPLYLIRSYSPTFYSFEWSFSIAALLCCLRLKSRHSNRTSLVVLATGTLTWAICESLLYLLGTRSNGSSDSGLVSSFVLFGVSIDGSAGGVMASITRGIAEGGVITLLGLIPADLYRGRHPRDPVLLILLALTFLLYLLTTFASTRKEKDVGGEVDSRREMFLPGSVVTTILFTTVPVLQILISKNKAFRRRTLDLLAALTVVGLLTNYQMYLCNVRWVETKTEDGGFERAGWGTEQLLLMYDGVVEIGFMYLPFYTVPWALGLIKDDEWVGGEEAADNADGEEEEEQAEKKWEPLLASV